MSGFLKSRAHLLVNFALFQLAWFACVLGGANGIPFAGTAAVAIAVAVHLRFAARPYTELRLLGIVALIGAAWDSMVVSTGLMTYPSGMFLPGIAPHWIIAMWVNFAVTLNVSMGWLKGRTLLAAIFGGLGGPLAYLTGFKLGGVVIPDFWLGLGIQGLGWAMIMPLLLVLADRFDGISKQSQAVNESAGVTSRV